MHCETGEIVPSGENQCLDKEVSGDSLTIMPPQKDDRRFWRDYMLSSGPTSDTNNPLSTNKLAATTKTDKKQSLEKCT